MPSKSVGSLSSRDMVLSQIGHYHPNFTTIADEFIFTNRWR
jgi:hypothetical protein